MENITPVRLPAELGQKTGTSFSASPATTGHAGHSQAEEHDAGRAVGAVKSTLHFPAGNIYHPTVTSLTLFDFRLPMEIILESLCWAAS